MAQDRFDADLHIIANSDLEITKMGGDLKIIQKLSDEPNDQDGLTADQLKAKFDEAGLTIQTYINETLIPQANGTIAVEAQRVANENQRQANEDARQSAEAERVTAETNRGSAENGRQSAETARGTAEAGRVNAENGRVDAESSRVTAENGRNSAETARENAETARGNAETGRSQAESGRVGAENGRVSAENARAAAETARASAENARVTAENGRVSAENARVQAETARESAQAAFFQGVSASAEMLPQGSDATASAVPDGGSFRVNFGIPAGGPAGKSAYQYAVDGGYTGTEAEFQALMGSGPWLPLDGGDVELPVTKNFLYQVDSSGQMKFITGATVYEKLICFDSGLAVENKPIKGVANPESSYDAANKIYVDSAVSGAKVFAKKITVTPNDILVVNPGDIVSGGIGVNAGTYLTSYTFACCFPDNSSKNTADTCKITHQIDGWYVYFYASSKPTVDLTYIVLAFP